MAYKMFYDEHIFADILKAGITGDMSMLTFLLSQYPERFTLSLVMS